MLISILPLGDAERQRVATILGGGIHEDGTYILAEADEAQCDKLEADGILFTAEKARPAEDVAKRTGASLESADDDDVENAAPDAPFVLHFDGPLSSGRLALLQEEGIQIARRLGPGRYLVEADAASIGRVVDANSWLSYSRYGVVETLGADLAAQVAAALDARPLLGGARLESADDEIMPMGGAGVAADEPSLFDVQCESEADLRTLAAELEDDADVAEVRMGGGRLRYRVDAGPLAEARVLQKLGHNGAVLRAERYVAPQPMLDYAATGLFGATDPAHVPSLPWHGEGETIGVADTGVDVTHPDLAGRTTVSLRVQPASPNDPHGHGTHVASIAAGNGTASGGALRSPAWASSLFFQSLANANLKYEFDVGLTDLLQEAYDAGVRILNYSWGSVVDGRYTLDANDIDAFVWKNPDLLVVIAAGNFGEQDQNDPGKRTALRSLASPASAKNAITVGASCSPRSDGPYQGKTWQAYDGLHPPQMPPLSALPLTGDANVVAALSSRGPTEDSRLKPDLVAPGVGIAAAKSADSSTPPAHPYPGSNQYMFLSGTSMAAPLVAAAAAVVRQYYREARDHTPSAALLKSTLINGCDWLPAAPFVDDRIGSPNFHQGFGRLNLLRAIPAGEPAPFVLSFVDIGSSDDGALRIGSGDQEQPIHQRSFTTKNAGPLSITLAWTDPPARAIQHNLDLVLTGPTGTKYLGNGAMSRLAYEPFDSTNNVEQIRIDDAPLGNWVVRVVAKNTFGAAGNDGQGFALVVTGAL